MKQYVKMFSNYDRCIDDVINDYLEEHSNYEIDNIFLLCNGNLSDRVVVVFKINPITKTYTVARGVTE